tara:strand:- start:2 stop:520 length:519 start_codon:yes stop_codon:yes gene_type:complete
LEEKKNINYFEHLVAPGKASDFFSIFESVINKTPYSLVRLKISGSDELQIQIMAEKKDKSMVIEDCKKLSTMLIDFIEDPKSNIENYILEVSSPGIDRPLTSKEDFSYWAGSNIMMKLKKPINSLKKYEGTLKGFFNEKIEIDISGGHEENLLIEPETIKSINVVWSPETSQ